mgnify:CR=1 FL=1
MLYKPLARLQVKHTTIDTQCSVYLAQNRIGQSVPSEPFLNYEMNRIGRMQQQSKIDAAFYQSISIFDSWADGKKLNLDPVCAQFSRSEGYWE